MKTESSQALDGLTVAPAPEPIDPRAEDLIPNSDKQVFQAVGRTAAFWRRAGRIYFGYKNAQVRAALHGRSSQAAKDEFWQKHHAWAGSQMYSLAVDLRGFYLKVRHGCSSVVADHDIQSSKHDIPRDYRLIDTACRTGWAVFGSTW